MSENIRVFTPALSDSCIPSAESFGFSTQEMRQFQGRVFSTFEDMISSGEHDDLLGRFRNAYEFRGQYPWNVESGKMRDKPNGLVQSVDNMMRHSKVTFYGLVEEDRKTQIDDPFKQELIASMREASQLNQGIVTLASVIIEQGLDIATVDQINVKQAMEDAINTYWDRSGFPTIVKI